jgi:hypothetical protein
VEVFSVFKELQINKAIEEDTGWPGYDRIAIDVSILYRESEE